MIPNLKYTLAVLMTMLLGCTIAVGFVALRGARQGMQFLCTIERSSTETGGSGRSTAFCGR